MNILYVGNFHDGTGYARACCETAVALDAAGANVICRPITFNGGRNPCPVRISQLEDKPLPNRIDVVVQHTLPSAMAYDVRCGLNVASFYYEASHFLSSGWALRLNEMDLILTTPGISAESCANSSVRTQVVPLPLPSDPSRYCLSYRSPSWLSPYHEEQKFIFYTISENVRRKNLGGLIKAFLIAFRATDPVILVVKTSGDGKKVYAMIHELAQGLKLCRHAEIVVVTERLSDDDLMGLHDNANCFVQASCGEAWSYPAFDAMAMGNTPIVPDTETYRSYISDEAGYLVPTYLEPCSGGADEPADLYRADELWQVPSTKGLVEAMQRAYQEDAQSDAKASLGLDVAYRFTPQRVGKTLLEAITNAAQEKLARFHGRSS
jgi:glycosyltransferase involved in cell wall biosynthesis